MGKPKIQATNEQAKPAAAEASAESAQQPTEDQKTEQVTAAPDQAEEIAKPSAEDLDLVVADPSLAPDAKIEIVIGPSLISKATMIPCIAMRAFAIGDRKVGKGDKLELSLTDYDALTGVMPNAIMHRLSDDKRAYFVKSSLRIDGRFYEAGQAVMLEVDQALQLVNSGAVEPLKEE